MLVSDFDSNGLIFLLNPKAVGYEENMEQYFSAVENILDVQGFSCIPLVDAPRIRVTTNDLRTRAVYQEGGGNVTHLLRRSMPWEDGPFVMFERKDVDHIDEDRNVLQAVTSMFAKHPEGPYPIMVTVGGTKDHPTAIFSQHELLSERTKLELYRQFSVYESDQPDDQTSHFINTSYRKLTREMFDTWSFDHFETFVGKLTQLSRGALASNVVQSLKPVQHRASPHETKLNYGNFRIEDIMQHACVGIRWKHGVPLGDQPKENVLAKELLSKANDFTYLAVFNETNKLQNAIVKDSGQQSKEIRFVSASSLLETFFQHQSSKQRELAAIVEPDPSILTAEGPMRWPAMVTEQELRSKLAALNYFVLVSTIESEMKGLIHQQNLHRDWERRKNQNNNQSEIKWLNAATLGSILSVLKQKKNERKIKSVLGIENVDTLRKSIKKIRDLRNELAHGALEVFFHDHKRMENISLNQIKALYEVKTMLSL